MHKYAIIGAFSRGIVKVLATSDDLDTMNEVMGLIEQYKNRTPLYDGTAFLKLQKYGVDVNMQLSAARLVEWKLLREE